MDAILKCLHIMMLFFLFAFIYLTYSHVINAFGIQTHSVFEKKKNHKKNLNDVNLDDNIVSSLA
mgnify:CR=1 FL=1